MIREIEIGPYLSLALKLAILPNTVNLLAISSDTKAISILLLILEVTKVQVTIVANKNSVTIHLVVQKMAIVDRSIRLVYLSKA